MGMGDDLYLLRDMAEEGRMVDIREIVRLEVGVGEGVAAGVLLLRIAEYCDVDDGATLLRDATDEILRAPA